MENVFLVSHKDKSHHFQLTIPNLRSEFEEWPNFELIPLFNGLGGHWRSIEVRLWKCLFSRFTWRIITLSDFFWSGFWAQDSAPAVILSWRITILQDNFSEGIFFAVIFFWRIIFLKDYFSEGTRFAVIFFCRRFYSVIIFAGDQSLQWFFSQVFCRQWSF